MRMVSQIGRTAALLVGLCLTTSLLHAQSATPRALPAGAIQVRGDSAAWTAGPPTLPAGTQMMLLEGDPRSDGIFTLRIKLPAGARLQPHWHPQHERVTVLSGLARVGFGEEFDELRMTSFGPGSFYVNPPRSNHYVWIVEETVMQLTGVGSWELHFSNASP
ncbi:MAG: cupin domain-containing protein [Longimicrobiaceae bacterium]